MRLYVTIPLSVTHLPPAPASSAGVRGRCQGIAYLYSTGNAICDRGHYKNKRPVPAAGCPGLNGLSKMILHIGA
jgi:hypothetical protein